MAPAPRQDLISSAVTFLRDPSVSSSPIEKRIEFLRSKNLTQEEIDIALSQANTDTPPSTSANQAQPFYPPPSPQQYQGYPPPYPYGQQYPPPPPPEPPRRDWRDYFILATVVGGASYGICVLANRYIRPLIAPPTPPQLEQDKAAIDEQFQRAFALLDTLTEDTSKLKEAEEARTKRLDSAISDIEAIVSELKSANTRREDDARRMEGEIRSVKDALPRAIDGVKESNEKQLKELAAELSSLKALMGNRLGSSTNPPTSAGYNLPNVPRAPSANANAYTPTSTTSTSSRAGPETSIPGSTSNPTGVSSSSTVPSYSMPSSANPSANANTTAPTSNTGNASVRPATTNLGYGAGKVSIPAWQLAAQKNSEAAAAAATKPVANGVQKDDGADAIAAAGLQASGSE